MALLPVPESRGVWRSTAPVGSPGTYAFIVGISKYDLLDGRAEHLGLKSLFVSALSAFQFFNYLSSEYLYESGPMFEATLLLSATEEEQTLIEGSGAGINIVQTPKPTLNEMCTQLRAFRARLASLSPEAAAKSRIIFFYSGHGIELDPDRQLLLPADYPGVPITYNDAVSTRNVWQGFGSLPIPTQMFFIDACRSDVPALYALSALQGRNVFDEWRGGNRAAAPIFYASAAGESAWQPSRAKDLSSASYYTEALLDALLVRNISCPFRPDASTAPATISLFPLYEYVQRSLLTRRELAGKVGERAVMMGGAVTNCIVSQWHATERPPEPVQSVDHKFADSAISDVASQVPGGRGPERIADRIEKLRKLDELVVEHATANAVSYVASEAALSRAQLYTWEQEWGSWSQSPVPLAYESITPLSKGKLQFASGNAWRWIDMEIPNKSGDGSMGYGFLLPYSSSRSTSRSPIFQVQFVPNASGAIADVRITLALEQDDFDLRVAARMWDGYARASTIGGLQAFTKEFGGIHPDAISLLQHKYDSPLGATIAALILFRTPYADQLWDWYENLALRVAESSDAAVFCLRRLIERGDYNKSSAEAYLQRIVTFGTPVTTEACAMLMNQLADFVGYADSGSSPYNSSFGSMLTSYLHELFPSLAVGEGFLGTFQRASSILRSGGLFTTVASTNLDWVHNVLR